MHNDVPRMYAMNVKKKRYGWNSKIFFFLEIISWKIFYTIFDLRVGEKELP